MNLTEEKAKLEAQLETITKEQSNLNWKANTIKAQIRQLDKLITKASEIMRPDGNQNNKETLGK